MLELCYNPQKEGKGNENSWNHKGSDDVVELDVRNVHAVVFLCRLVCAFCCVIKIVLLK